jgi:outer membrane protein assembly factor BamA
VEGFLTNRGGFLGTSGSLNYRHKNVFRTMTSLQASLTLGFEGQQRLSPQTSSEDASTSIGQDLFNTVVIGPEVKITFPVKAGSAKSGGSRVVVNALYNYQRRPDYTRSLAKGALGWEINPTFTETWGFYIPEVNLIRISHQDPSFAAFLDSTQDVLLKNSYTDHIIINLPRIAYTWNSAAVQKKRNAHFLRGSLDFAGTLLRWYDEVTGAPLFTDSITSGSFYKFDGVRFAEYVKLDLDYRYYHTIHDRSSIAFRFAPGVAKTLVNQTAMPFETSFYSGGANGIRAWRARSLGPGGYRSGTNNFDRIGEVRIEGNVEYRFKLFGYLEGALFTDVGNIWTLQKNDAKPEGQFKTEKFVSQIAVGTGVGARLNFDFFLVRFDLGLQTKDPSFPAGQRWIFQPHEPDYQTDLVAKLNFNLGIGYPF